MEATNMEATNLHNLNLSFFDIDDEGNSISPRPYDYNNRFGLGETGLGCIFDQVCANSEMVEKFCFDPKQIIRYKIGRIFAENSNTSMRCIWPICESQLFIPALDTRAGHIPVEASSSFNRNLAETSWGGTVYSNAQCPAQPCNNAVFLLKEVGANSDFFKQFRQDCGQIPTFWDSIEGYFYRLSEQPFYFAIIAIVSLLMSIAFRGFYKLLYKENPNIPKQIFLIFFSITLCLIGSYIYANNHTSKKIAKEAKEDSKKKSSKKKS
jgi:hypothetical protein